MLNQRNTFLIYPYFLWPLQKFFKVQSNLRSIFKISSSAVVEFKKDNEFAVYLLRAAEKLPSTKQRINQSILRMICSWSKGRARADGQTRGPKQPIWVLYWEEKKIFTERVMSRMHAWKEKKIKKSSYFFPVCVVSIPSGKLFDCFLVARHSGFPQFVNTSFVERKLEIGVRILLHIVVVVVLSPSIKKLIIPSVSQISK